MQTSELEMTQKLQIDSYRQLETNIRRESTLIGTDATHSQLCTCQNHYQSPRQNGDKAVAVSIESCTHESSHFVFHCNLTVPTWMLQVMESTQSDGKR